MECYIGLGANLGDRELALRQALERLHGERGTELRRVSRFYETEPWGKKEQPPFVNATAKVRTDRTPMEFLRLCQRIEGALGRERKERWGARRIDIDLLCIPGAVVEEPELTLPHPYLTERMFVLLPLEEIAPHMRVSGRSVREHRMACRDRGRVSPCGGSPVDFAMQLIACVDACGGIGREGELLFHLPEDMAFFRKKTLGGTVIMGRRTMEAIGGPLEGRRNILLSRRRVAREGFTTCGSLEELWAALAASFGENIFVIGGGEVYGELLPYCREAWITKVGAEARADVFLRGIGEEFSLASSVPAVDEGYELEFCHYMRNS